MIPVALQNLIADIAKVTSYTTVDAFLDINYVERDGEIFFAHPFLDIYVSPFGSVITHKNKLKKPVTYESNRVSEYKGIKYRSSNVKASTVTMSYLTYSTFIDRKFSPTMKRRASYVDSNKKNCHFSNVTYPARSKFIEEIQTLRGTINVQH